MVLTCVPNDLATSNSTFFRSVRVRWLVLYRDAYVSGMVHFAIRTKRVKHVSTPSTYPKKAAYRQFF